MLQSLFRTHKPVDHMNTIMSVCVCWPIVIFSWKVAQKVGITYRCDDHVYAALLQT